MQPKERAVRLKKMLEQVAPAGNLEALSTPTTSGTLESFETGTPISTIALEKLSSNAMDRLSPQELDNLEAIVLPRNRPVVFIHGDSYDDLGEPWAALNAPETKSFLGRNFASIGRVNVPNSPLLPYAGTGFVVGDGLMMTNRHVAELFSSGLGKQITYTAGDAAVGFGYEEGETADPVQLKVMEVALIHPYWDMALLRVEGLTQKPLDLSTADTSTLIDDDIAVIGYPAFDPRSNVSLQNSIFQSTFNVKRLQPGKLRPFREVDSFKHRVNAVTHDASTLGGNSGSAILHVQTGKVIALHFAGVYLEANYAVPTYEIAQDSRLWSLLPFKPPVPATHEFDASWQNVSGSESRSPDTSASTAPAFTGTPLPPAPPNPPAPSLVPRSFPSLSFVFPIHFTISPGAPVAAGPAPGLQGAITLPAPEPTEGVVVDQDYSDREGYDPDFLGDVTVPLPTIAERQKKLTAQVPVEHRKRSDPYELTYHHYSVYMNTGRRTAWFSAANVDGGHRPDIGKREGDRWYVDPRISRDAQLSQVAFEHGIDRGHLTRREDTAWGRTTAIALAANNDTFHFTNCSLQASMFNRGKDRWQGLEQFLLEKHAKKEKRRMIVITGPLFSSNDPTYQNDRMEYSVRCPLQFWKVCVLVRQDDSLAATGFLLGQNEISDLPGMTEAFEVGLAQVTIGDLEKKTGLKFGELAKHDHFAQMHTPGELEMIAIPDLGLSLRPIESLEDIVI